MCGMLAGMPCKTFTVEDDVMVLPCSGEAFAYSSTFVEAPTRLLNDASTASRTAAPASVIA